MIFSRAALRLILLKEEGRRWREQIDELDTDGEFVSAAFLSFSGNMMMVEIGVILCQVGFALLLGLELPDDWKILVMALPLYGMVLGIAQSIAFRLLHTFTRRETGWYWWPRNFRIIATMIDLGSIAGMVLLFRYVI